jgi:hypothetical protein
VFSTFQPPPAGEFRKMRVNCRYCGDNGKLGATMAVERTEPSVATRAEDEKESAVPAGADRPPTSEEEEAAESAQLDQETKESVTKHYKEMAELGADVEGEGHIP